MKDLFTIYPSLRHVQPPLASLGHAAMPVFAPTGGVLFEENSACKGFPMIISGEVQVSRRSDEGRSLQLYRVVAGEFCMISSASLFRSNPMSAYGVATKDTWMILIPPHIFRLWLENTEFRDEILGFFADRMADLSSLLDTVTFCKLDQRLATALLGHGNRLSLSHQDLANELGTVREVVTRLLRRFEREGWISLSRASIEIHNAPALRNLSLSQ